MFIPVAGLQSFFLEPYRLPGRAAVQGRDHADGVLPSANVPRPAYGRSSSLISLREARHRRDPDARWLIRPRQTAWPRHPTLSNFQRNAPTETNCKDTNQ